MDIYPKSQFILSNYLPLYLDCGFGNYFGNNAWCNPASTWRSIYYWEPTNYTTPEHMERVLGAEIC